LRRRGGNLTPKASSTPNQCIPGRCSHDGAGDRSCKTRFRAGRKRKTIEQGQIGAFFGSSRALDVGVRGGGRAAICEEKEISDKGKKKKKKTLCLPSKHGWLGRAAGKKPGEREGAKARKK